MKTLRTHQPTSSDNATLHLTAPRSWAELTPTQWRYTLTMMCYRMPLEVKVLMLLRFCGIEVVRQERTGLFRCNHIADGGKKVVYLQGWQVQQLIHTFDFIDSYETYTVELDSVGGLKAVDALLHEVPFYDYLVLEKLYNGFLRNRNNTGLLEKMGHIMYPKDKEHKGTQHFDEWQRLHVFLWYSYIKKELARFFPNFFQPATGASVKVTERMVLSQTDVQMRALTGGDITKEEEIGHMDCWRALTELDAKAREAAETRKMLKKKR